MFGASASPLYNISLTIRKKNLPKVIKSLHRQQRSVISGFYIPESKLIYCSVPKAGSTKLKQWFHCLPNNLKKCELQSNFNYYHQTNNFKTQKIIPLNTLDYSKLSELLLDDSIYKFTVVRNPYLRILSAYLMFSRSNRPLLMIPSKRNHEVEFSEFLHSLYETITKKSDWNQHWREQTNICSLDFFEYIHLEDFENSFHYFSELDKIFKIDTKKLLIKMFGRSDNHDFNAMNHIAEFFKCSDAKIVAELYKKDFSLLDYSPQLFLDSLCLSNDTRV